MAAQAAVVQLCDVCDSEDNVRWYCKDCHEVMCESCKAVHLRSRKTKNDDVIPLSEARDIQKIPAIWCDLHSSEEVRGNCQQCDELICIICLHEKHNGHKWLSLDEFRNAASKEFEEVRERCSVRLLSGQRIVDQERETLQKKSSHFDKIKIDIKNQTDKIIHEVTKLRDETLRSVSKACQTELDRHIEIIDSITRENAEIQPEMVKLVNFRENANPSEVIKSAKVATQALTRLGELRQPSSMVLPTFQCGSIYRRDLQAMLGTCMLNDKPGKHYRVTDKSKLKVVSYIKVPRKTGFVKNIIPDNNGNFWVSTTKDDYLTLIQKDGVVMKTSEKFSGIIKDAVAFNDSFLLTCQNAETEVMKISPGNRISTFSKHDPYLTGGLCVTPDGLDVLVFLQNRGRAKIARLGPDAVVKEVVAVSEDVHCEDRSCRFVCLHSGEIFVSYWPLANRTFGWHVGSTYNVVSIDRNGSSFCDYDTKIDGISSRNRCIARDSYSNVFVTDVDNNRVLLLGLNGTVTCFLDQSMGLKNPYAIVVPRDGQLMIGCDAGRIICVEY